MVRSAVVYFEQLSLKKSVRMFVGINYHQDMNVSGKQCLIQLDGHYRILEIFKRIYFFLNK